MAGMFASLVLNILSLTPFTWCGALPGYFNIIISVALTVFVSLLTKKQELSESIQAVIDL